MYTDGKMMVFEKREDQLVSYHTPTTGLQDADDGPSLYVGILFISNSH